MVARSYGEGRIGSLVGTEFHEEDEKVLEMDDGDGCTDP